ncbi:LacI family DNA-binding transcriptional regulator [Silicimonas sp. MF1-12-2]|uniref:LacI family DNA-binding transcriptional regulator n=1 Tax=Silicimonas sp. MF1-12-2 TaxID=3384793 RepID=UPI0039B54B4E
MGKPTVHDIAKEAGVSLATVDRVLNSRPGVREKTVDRVREAVERLGYVRDINAANLARQRRYRFVFLLPEGESQFLESLEAAVDEAGSGLIDWRCELEVIRTTFRDPPALAEVERRILQTQTDGVAIMGHETPLIRDMVARLKARGLTVVALVTDQPNSERDHFIGIDNMAAGRTAGVLMGRFLGGRSGRVAVIVNSTQSRDMVDRRAGFDEVIASRFPNILALPSLEGRDDRERVAAVLEACIDRQGPLIGIYCAGAGTRGVTRVIAERGLSDQIVVVAHELTPHCRQALEEGTVDVVITQNVGHIVRSAVRVLRAKSDEAEINEGQEKIRIEIAIKENLS